MLRLSISVKLILISTLLLVFVVSGIAFLDNMKSRRVIDAMTQRLQQKKVDGLKKAGTSQLQLLAETARIALLESEYKNLGQMLINMGRQDERITGIAVVDRSGRVIAHDDPRRVGKMAAGDLQGILTTDKMTQRMGVTIGGQESIAFAGPVAVRGSRLGVVFIAYSLKPLTEQLQQTRKLKQKELRDSVVNTVAIGTLAILVGVCLAIFLGLGISRPIRALAEQVNRIASGEFNARVSVRLRDEVGQLGERFNHMASRIQQLMEEVEDKAIMEKEIELATAVQSTIMPRSSQVTAPGLILCGRNRPAFKCSGDWWTYHALPDGRLLIMIGDVTGHGIATALMTAVAKGAVGPLIAGAEADLPADSLLVALNDAFYESSRGKIAMTCCCSIYDPRTRTLSTANAAHNFPYRYDAATEEIRVLASRGKRLGTDESTTFKIRQDEIKTGDMIVWYTDGIVESVDKDDNDYGGQRLRTLILEHAKTSPEELVEAIFTDVIAFCAGMEQRDDLTIVAARVV